MIRRKKFTTVSVSVLLAFALVAACLCALIFAAPEKVQVQAESSMFTPTSGWDIQYNVDVPDYMKRGKHIDYPSSTIKDGTEDDLEDWQKNGIFLTSTSAGKAIEFSTLIDMSQMNSSTDLLTFSPYASFRGSYDYQKLQIRFTDAADENNWVNISVEYSRFNARRCMVKISTPDISARGLRYGGAVDREVSTSNGLSDMVEMTLSGYTYDNYQTLSAEEARHRPFTLIFDPATTLWQIRGQGGRVFNILQLNYGYNSGYGSEWQGFKSHFAKMSITLENFQSSSASVYILKVAGQPMNGAAIADTKAPSLYVDCDEDDVPQAVVGAKYNIFSYECADLHDGVLDANISVKDPDGNAVSIEDGAFTPAKVGRYTLTYSAKDAAGNEAEKSFFVFANDGLQTPLSVEVEDMAKTSFSVGETVQLPAVTKASGGAGRVTTSLEVTRVGSKDPISSIVDGRFTPTLDGTYVITYTATDYLGNKASASTKITVSLGDAPYLDESSIQKVLRLYDGVAVKLPSLPAFDYKSKLAVKQKAKYTVAAYSADGTAEEKIENNVFTPTKEKFGDSVRIEYKYYCDGYESSAGTYSYTVPLQDKPTKVSDYFAYDENVFDVSMNASGEFGYIKLKTSEVGSQSFSFVNPIAMQSFWFAFSVPAREKNFSSVTVSLRDFNNALQGYDFTICEVPSSAPDATTTSYVYYNGTRYAMTGTFNRLVSGEETTSANPLQIRLSGNSLIGYNGKVIFTPTVNVDGTPFTGFASGRVMIKVTFNDVVGESAMTISRLGNQTFYADYDRAGNLLDFEDEIRPQIFLKSDVADTLTYGQTATVPLADAFDVLDTTVEVFVTLTSPSGKTLLNRVPANEVHTFVADEYGTYRVSYSAQDASGNRQTANYSIKLSDLQSPTITLSSSAPITAKLGSTVTLPSFSVADNLDPNPKCSVFVTCPDMSIVAVDISKMTFTAPIAGKYKVVYYAYDESGNPAIRMVELTVQ